MSNNPNLDPVNINAHTKFSKILYSISQDIERKQNYDRQPDGRTETRNGRQPKSNIAPTDSKLYNLTNIHTVYTNNTYEIGSGQTKNRPTTDGWKQRIRQNYIPVILSGDKKNKLLTTKSSWKL